MIRPPKSLKPYLLLLAVAVVLLFVQADANLALPDYFAKIVNVGIQQQGIEDAVPAAMRRVTMDRLTLFMEKEQSDQVLAAYTLVDDTSADYAGSLLKYPSPPGGPVSTRRHRPLRRPEDAPPAHAVPDAQVDQREVHGDGAQHGRPGRRRVGARRVPGPRRGHGEAAGELHAAHRRPHAAADPARRLHRGRHRPDRRARRLGARARPARRGLPPGRGLFERRGRPGLRGV